MTQAINTKERQTQIIESDQEAIEIAQQLAEEFAKESAARDRHRRLPHAELEKLSASGFWGITIPKQYGGASISNVALAEVTKILS